MPKFDKLAEKTRNNPRDVRVSDARWLAQALGFNAKSSSGTSHHAYSKTGEPAGLNFQDRGDGKIPAYQARQLIAMLDKYGGDPIE